MYKTVVRRDPQVITEIWTAHVDGTELERVKACSRVPGDLGFLLVFLNPESIFRVF